MRTNTNLVHLAIFQAIGFVDWPEPCLMLNLYKQNCLVILEGTSFMYHSKSHFCDKDKPTSCKTVGNKGETAFKILAI